jgi:hypothetical protein
MTLSRRQPNRAPTILPRLAPRLDPRARLIPQCRFTTMSLRSVPQRLSTRALRRPSTCTHASQTTSRAMPQWQTCRNVASTPTAEKWVFEQSDMALNHIANTDNRVLFPGALNSEFTNNLEFLRPSQNKAISTFRILDQYGQVLDKERGVDTTDEEALELYRHMVCCKTHSYIMCTWPATNGLSKHHGSDYVRGTATRKTKLLHGMLSLCTL